MVAIDLFPALLAETPSQSWALTATSSARRLPRSLVTGSGGTDCELKQALHMKVDKEKKLRRQRMFPFRQQATDEMPTFSSLAAVCERAEGDRKPCAGGPRPVLKIAVIGRILACHAY